MASTRYKFEIKQEGWAEEDPHYDAWHRTFAVDDQAERFAKHLSADNGNCDVWISRPGAKSWRVWSGYLPRRMPSPAYDAGEAEYDL